MKIKNIIFFVFCVFIFIPSLTAAKEPKVSKSKYFDTIKKYSKKSIALNDTLEFSVFDMENADIINDSKPIALKQTKAEEPAQSLSALDELNKRLNDLPKHFYMNLKQAIERQTVPITLYPNESPSYTRPLKLYVKVKYIHLKSNQKTAEGTDVQPIEMRIFGQLIDKEKEEVLVKFYDTTTTQYTLSNGETNKALNRVAYNLMGDLANYLKTQY